MKRFLFALLLLLTTPAFGQIPPGQGILVGAPIIGGSSGDLLYNNATKIGSVTPGTGVFTALQINTGTTGALAIFNSGVNGNVACLTATGINDCGVGPITSANGGTVFGNNGATSALPQFTPAPVLGINATTTGTLGLANGGGGGATATLQNLGATSAYNFNLPTTAGTATYLLASGGGGSTSMTWTTYVAPAAWTPTDGSGAGLTFAAATGRYTKIGQLCTATFDVTYPATADGSNATLASIPAACAANATVASGCYINTSNIGAGPTVGYISIAATTSIQFMSATDGNWTNTQLSTHQVRGTCHIITAS